jgi:hypothetical protein
VRPLGSSRVLPGESGSNDFGQMDVERRETKKARLICIQQGLVQPSTSGATVKRLVQRSIK